MILKNVGLTNEMRLLVLLVLLVSTQMLLLLLSQLLLFLSNHHSQDIFLMFGRVLFAELVFQVGNLSLRNQKEKGKLTWAEINLNLLARVTHNGNA